MSSRRKGSNESKDMWLKVNQKSLMKFEGVFTRFSGHFGMLIDKGQVRVIGGKLLPYELNHSPTDACQSLQLPH